MVDEHLQPVELEPEEMQEHPIETRTEVEIITPKELEKAFISV